MGKQVSEKLSFAEQRQCKNNMWHAVEGQVEKHTTTKYRFMYVRPCMYPLHKNCLYQLGYVLGLLSRA